MLKSIYTPLAGAKAQERVLDIIANNLANTNTTAFKGDRVTFTLKESEPEKNYKDPLPPANYKVGVEDLMFLHGNDINYVAVSEVKGDFSQGPSIETGNETDLMVEGEGFFRVMTVDGDRFTRDGALKINQNGILTTSEGHPVLGEKGDIAVKAGSFSVNHQGEVWQNGELVDRIQLFKVKDSSQLERVGSNLYLAEAGPEGLEVVKNPRVLQGFIEGSNVNPIRNLTNMIVAHRTYEAYQKTISNYDQMMEKSSNRIGAVRA